MSHLTWVGGIATAALAALSLTACSPDSPAAAPSMTTSASPISPASPSASSAPTTSSLSPEQKESELAAAAITAYWQVLDQLAADPSKTLTELSTVAVDPALAQWQRILTLRRGDQVTQSGSTVVDTPSAKSKGGDQWDATACIDVTKVTLVDKDGKSVVKADRPPRVRYNYVVKKINQKFFVMEDQAVGLC